MDTKTVGDSWKTGKGHVYFIIEKPSMKDFRNGIHVPVKIGKCGHQPETRRRGLQAGNHRELIILEIIPANDADTLERAIHKHFADKHISLNGGGTEWFRLSRYDVLHAHSKFAPLTVPSMI